MPGEWDSEVDNWTAWARTPGHDVYWDYRDDFFTTVVPRPGRATLEVGCGEGRVARDLVARGHRVTAVDTAAGLVANAAEVDEVGHYVVSDSAALPFPAASFDLAVAYNSLQVVGDMAATAREVARVLAPHGSFCIVVSHPVTDLGAHVDAGGDRRFALRRRYFERERVDDTVDRGGLTVTFRGWTYTLEDYSLAFEAAGFVVEAIREPRPTPAQAAAGRTVPMFMYIRARRT